VNSPLQGRRVLVTRASAQASELGDLLSGEGAVPIVIPVMRLQRLVDPASLDGLRERITAGDFEDLVLTSANSVRLLLGAAPLAQAGVRAYAIGPGTRAALNRVGWVAEPLPQGFIAESLVQRIASGSVAGRRMLLPRARGARDVLPRRLEEMGALVEVVELYQMIPDWGSQSSLAARLRSGELDCVTFTSGSTVRCFVELAGSALPPAAWVWAAIGPITAAEMSRHGLIPQVVARTHSLPGLVDALRAWFAGLPENGSRP
jgi:uroporphyrinogen III methyltransferase/synthase